MTSGPPTLQARGVSKAFGRTVALSDVALDLHAGEAHGLVGENGAGKSSLLKILTGIYRADSGTLALDGSPYAPRGPEEARAAGLALVPQELRIVPAMTVADNVLLGRWPTRRGAVDHRRMLEQAADALARLGLRLDPRATMGSLSFAERQAVVLAREVGTEATRVLILDEPTASLERAEVERLFALVARLRERQVGVLFVSHRLDEVRHLCDRVTVLRDGRLVAVHARGAFTEADLARDMTGRVLDAAHAPGDRAAGEELVSLPLGEERISLRRGRVSGLAGLLGSGSGELLRRIFGAADARDAGLRVHGQARRVASPADAIAAGFGYVPSERARALVPALSVRDNIVLPHLARFTSRLGGYDAAAADRAVLDLIRRLDIRPADPSLPARALSGGNQQKLLFARWLMGEFHTLLLDEPTHGIDVAAKRQVLRLVDRFATEGGGVLLASAELHEILAIADDIVALRDGRPRLRIARGSPDFTEGALRSALGA
jgi:ABC-type sugar transport system ATPase subunit